MGECLNCKRYQLSASMWRNEAYKHAGIELPWKPEELLQKEYERGFSDGKKWVGLTKDEVQECQMKTTIFIGEGIDAFARAIEDKLREKNS